MATSTRRQPVAQGGGLFSAPKPSFSKETQDLLKLMMQESKLTNFQQRKLKESMKSGQALPAQCPPTSSSPGKPGVRVTGRKKTEARDGVGGGLRSREMIQRLAAKDDSGTSYRPPPQKYNTTKEKERLQNLMTFGKSDPAPASDVKHSAKQAPAVVEDKDRFEEVLEEIEERRQFLSDMEALGKGKEHHNKITTEISQKVRELEVIDKDRTAQLLNL